MANTRGKPRQPHGIIWERFKRFLARAHDAVPDNYFSGAHFRAGSLIPVHIESLDAPDAYGRTWLQPRESRWTLFTAWLRYHYIQMRWDIERVLARLLHRRWH